MRTYHRPSSRYEIPTKAWKPEHLPTLVEKVCSECSAKFRIWFKQGMVVKDLGQTVCFKCRVLAMVRKVKFPCAMENSPL